MPSVIESVLAVYHVVIARSFHDIKKAFQCNLNKSAIQGASQSIKFYLATTQKSAVEASRKYRLDLPLVQKRRCLNRQGHNPSTPDCQMTTKVPGP